jgi:transposase
MSLQRSSVPSIPPETVLVAKAAFPKGNVYMQMRDELGSIYDDALFASVYAEVGQPAIARLLPCLGQRDAVRRTSQ